MVAVAAGISVVEGVSVIACTCVGVSVADVTSVGISVNGAMVGKSVGAAPGVGVINGDSVGSGVSEMTATVVGAEVGAG